jgi:hypothetical protein
LSSTMAATIKALTAQSIRQISNLTASGGRIIGKFIAKPPIRQGIILMVLIGRLTN